MVGPTEDAVVVAPGDVAVEVAALAIQPERVEQGVTVLMMVPVPDTQAATKNNINTVYL